MAEPGKQPNDVPLRRGWTTGACATAAVRAAYSALLTGRFPDPVTIELPGGQRPAFALARELLTDGTAIAGIVKDAGDDPDVTHCALITATVSRGKPGSGVVFLAGEGVGTVTRPGLPVAVGEAAINPVPRRMMADNVAELAASHDDAGDVEIDISIPGGEEMARHTMNSRLGIEGGLSILGTTGIVVPFSCASWIASIHQGIDVARAEGRDHLAAATGSTSEKAVQAMFALPDVALIDMGDFAGGLLKYLRDHPVPLLTIAGGFAKITKLGQGHMDLHSGRSRVDTSWLAEAAGDAGADAALVQAIKATDTAALALQAAQAVDMALQDRVALLARETAQGVLDNDTRVDVLIFDRSGSLIGRADG